MVVDARVRDRRRRDPLQRRLGAALDVQRRVEAPVPALRRHVDAARRLKLEEAPAARRVEVDVRAVAERKSDSSFRYPA